MTRQCELCGSERNVVLFQGHDWLHGRSVSSEVVRCLQCGLVWLWPQPHSPVENYPDDYAPYQGQAARTGIALGSVQRGGLGRKVRLVERSAQAPLLDFGCAAGDFLVGVRDHMPGPLLGTDFNEKAVRRAKQRSGALVWVGSEQALPLRDGSLGSVTMWHVLEHLPRPLEALREIARVLRNDGIVAMACPMADSWEARLFGRFWAGYDVPRHLFAFSRSTVHSLLERAGYEPVEVAHVVYGYNSAMLSSAFWMQRFAFLRARRRLRHAAAVVLGFALALIFEILSLLLGNHRAVGVYVARKVKRPTANAPCFDRS